MIGVDLDLMAHDDLGNFLIDVSGGFPFVGGGGGRAAGVVILLLEVGGSVSAAVGG